ncbi:MAG: MFS transporter [Ottowia sp.]|uniref:MFS transporter n=1 Tax=Ottowia sp. TaxID=1898956 RepID=UPI0039E6173D
MAVAHAPKGGPLIETEAEKKIYSKVNWHILPLLLVAYVFAFIDRVNIGFAQLQMKTDLHLSDAVFALGAGLFFVGYFLFEVPSNLALEKIGARKTILRIMICWGACATAMAWVNAPWQFYVLRFLLGAFEAGFFPGVILYFTFWYPTARRGRAIAIFMTATALAGVLVGPLNGALMKYGEGFLGYHGWQWMFIANGVPCLIIAVLVFFMLVDSPAEAKWLTAEEKKILIDRVEGEKTSTGGHGHGAMRTLLKDPKVFILALTYFLMSAAVYALLFWAPTLIRSWGVADVFQIGMLKAVASVCGIIGMVLIGRSSDRLNDRRWHFAFAISCIVAGLGLIAMLAPSLGPSLALYSLATVGTSAATPLFFAFVSEYLSKETAAGGIALISSLGNLGPAISPSISTWILTTTGEAKYSLLFIISLYILAAIIMVAVARKRTPAGVVPQPA